MVLYPLIIIEKNKPTILINTYHSFIGFYIKSNKKGVFNMKKIIMIMILLIVCAITITVLVSCKPSEDNEPNEKNNISYIQTSFYRGFITNFEVRITAGKKEVLFVADGKTNDCKEFSTVTLIPDSTDLYNNEYKFIVTGENGELSGTLNKDSFGAYYYLDIDLSSIGKLKKVCISYANQEKEIELVDMLENKIDAKGALDIAKQTLQAKLDSDNKEREIYIRMINNTTDPNSTYYWYVAFIADPTDYYACLIEPINGGVVSCTK